MAYDDGVRIDYNTDNVLFQPGDAIQLTWSPGAVVPALDSSSYTVNIGLYCLNEATEEWDRVADLASDLPNSGSATVTMPNPTSIPLVCPISIQVTASQVGGPPEGRRQIPDSVLTSILGLGASIWGPIGELARSVALRALCEFWSIQQPANIGVNLAAQVEPCPPSAAQARQDNRFEGENPLVSGTFHPGSSSCFRQVVMNR